MTVREIFKLKVNFAAKVGFVLLYLLMGYSFYPVFFCWLEFKENVMLIQYVLYFIQYPIYEHLI